MDTCSVAELGSVSGAGAADSVGRGLGAAVVGGAVVVGAVVVGAVVGGAAVVGAVVVGSSVGSSVGSVRSVTSPVTGSQRKSV